jgi:hypothetical protein
MSLFRRTQRTHQPSASASRARRPRRQKLGLEALEGRQLLSLGPPDRVNTIPVADFEFGSANATNTHGQSVVAWVDTDFPQAHRIFAQMLNADGTKRGLPITVEANNLSHDGPAVAIDPKGNFVVAYMEKELDGHHDVVAKRFNSLGQQIGGRVANVVIGDNKNAYDPSVAMDGFGDFVISYTVDFTSTDQDVRARFFNSSGNFVQSLAFNGATGADETQSRVAMDSYGDIAIVWTKNQTEIDLARFSFDGTHPILDATGPAITGGRISAPSVAVADSGTMEIAYEFNDGSNGGLSKIGANRFDFYTGAVDGPPILIQSNAGTIVAGTSVANLSIGGIDGPFVVGYPIVGGFNGNGQFNTGGEVTVVDSLDSGNTIAERDTLFFAYDKTFGGDSVSVSANGATGTFLVTYTGMNPSDNNLTNIFEQVGNPFTGPAAKNLALTPTVQVGQVATLTGQLTDTRGDKNLTLTVNWGDGSKPQQSHPGLKAFAVKHKYVKPGVYKVHATWSDDHGLANNRLLYIIVKPGPAATPGH